MAVRITITIREPVKKSLEKIAKREDRSVSDVASALIEMALDVRIQK